MTTRPTYDEFKAARVLAERDDAFAEDAYQIATELRWRHADKVPDPLNDGAFDPDED